MNLFLRRSNSPHWLPPALDSWIVSQPPLRRCLKVSPRPGRILPRPACFGTVSEPVKQLAGQQPGVPVRALIVQGAQNRIRPICIPLGYQDLGSYNLYEGRIGYLTGAIYIALSFRQPFCPKQG